MYLHQATGTYTSLDLSVCFPTLLLDYDWKVHDDLGGSDHFPVLLNNIRPDVEEPVSRWKLNNANCAMFQTLSWLVGVTHVKYLGIMRINAIGKRYVPSVVRLNILLMKQTVNAQQNVLTAMKTTQLTRSNAWPGILKKKY